MTLRRSSLTLAIIPALTLACASGSIQSVPKTAGVAVAPGGCRPERAFDSAGAPVTAPSPIRCIFPRYPDSMRSAYIGGEVLVRVTIDSAGVPQAKTLDVVE